MGLGLVAAAGSARRQGIRRSPRERHARAQRLLNSGHFPARAKRVISIQMCGAVSQVDTFDYKPTLIKMHGQEIPPSVKNKGGRISAMSNAQSAFPLVDTAAPVPAVR